MTPYRAAAEAWAEMAGPHSATLDTIERNLRSNPAAVRASLGVARTRRAQELAANGWIETPTSLAAAHLARILASLAAQLEQAHHEASPDGISRAYIAP